MRLVALVKQTPRFETMTLGADGRLLRDGLPLEMSAYCRRAVAQAVALVAAHGGDVTFLTMGPPSARDVLREALTYADDHGVEARGLQLCDQAFAGSDTLATARALGAAIGQVAADGPVDLVLCGRNSVDADTGQVGPELAQLLGLPFLTGVKQVRLDVQDDGGVILHAGCELDDVWEDATVRLPAVVSTAERLIDPCKITDETLWIAADDARLDVVGAGRLGPGPWGQAGSPTRVGEIRVESSERAGRIVDGSLDTQLDALMALLAERGLLTGAALAGGFGIDLAGPAVVPSSDRDDLGGPVVAVVLEPGRERLGRELAAAAAGLASTIGGSVAVLGVGLGDDDADAWGGFGADRIVALEVVDPDAAPEHLPEEDVATAVSSWASTATPWAVLVGGTPWGREVAARAAASLGAGLTGDAVGLEVDAVGRLVAWKPAFGGALLAAIHCTSAVQMATVRLGVLALPEPRVAGPAVVEVHTFIPQSRVVVERRHREDDANRLAEARRVVGVGQGVDPGRYGELDGLLELLGAELAATRKVTDAGWLPHARQVGITAHAIAPDLYLALGTSGKYNHMVGVRAAGTVVAVNPDPTAPVFGFADLGLVASWDEVVPELERRIRAARTP